VNLVRFDYVFQFFITKKEIESFDDVKSASMTKDGDIINVEIVPFDGDRFFRYLDINNM
jgi:hypothetical protein